MNPGHDLEGLMRFLGREELWKERLQDVLNEHFGPALEKFEIDFEELGEIVGESWPMILWGCAFEDLLSREYGPDNENIIDLYLKRRGWSEAALNRAYIEGLRHSVVSLYEVVDVRPNEGMTLRNLLSEEDGSIHVREKSATRSLKKWDKIAARVVPRHDHFVIAGGLLPFTSAATEMLFEGIRQVIKLRSVKNRLNSKQLRSCAPLFVTAWLFTELERAEARALPQMTNSDGEPLIFHEIHFPFSKGVLQKDVAERLDKARELEAEGSKTWLWLASKKPGKRASAASSMFDEAMLLGSVELRGKAAILSVNSAARAERGIAMLKKATMGLLQTPLTSIVSVEQMMSEQPGNRHQASGQPDDLPPEIIEQIIREQMDRHYHDILGQPIPALGNRSPKQAIKSAKGRQEVIEWLKQIENRSRHQSGSPIGSYDFSWMWKELGLADEWK